MRASFSFGRLIGLVFLSVLADEQRQSRLWGCVNNIAQFILLLFLIGGARAFSVFLGALGAMPFCFKSATA